MSCGSLITGSRLINAESVSSYPIHLFTSYQPDTILTLKTSERAKEADYHAGDASIL